MGFSDAAPHVANAAKCCSRHTLQMLPNVVLTSGAVSFILQSWSKCLSLAGLYSRAEFALKAAATPSLFAKGQLAARSLSSHSYDNLISKSVFGVSFHTNPVATSSRASTSSRPGTTSRTGTRGGDESAVRRPVSGGVTAPAGLSSGSHELALPADLVSADAGAGDVECGDAVQHMMLQDDTDDIDPRDIAFHDIQSSSVHPDYTSWIDVALGASGMCG